MSNVNVNINISSITYQYLDDLDLMDLYHQHMDITICARKGARASGAQQRKRHSPTNHMPSTQAASTNMVTATIVLVYI